MKKMFVLLTAALLWAETLTFQLPESINGGNEIYKPLNGTETPQIEIPPTPQETVITEENNKTAVQTGKDETNGTQNINVQIPLPGIVEEDFNDTYVSINSKSVIAVMIDKRKFFKFIPSIMNSLNAYYAQKGIDYQISLYGIEYNISKIKADDIIYFTTDPNDIYKLQDYNKTFYLPLINRKETNLTAANIYFGSIDFQDQIQKLTSFIDDKTDIITDNTIISEKLLNYEINSTFIENIYKFPDINYEDLNNSFVMFNTSAGKTAQVLSKITQQEIDTKLNFISQIGYDPLMIILTQPADVEKLLIANSIIHTPPVINEYANILNSDIRYNWINYAACILANKAYNRQNEEDEFYMSDFNIYIFNNQINYNTKLYRIINGAFKQVE
ncbi:hypothetical protein [Nautilia sp.]